MLLICALAVADACPGALGKHACVMLMLLGFGASSGMLLIKHPRYLNSNCTQSVVSVVTCTHATTRVGRRTSANQSK